MTDNQSPTPPVRVEQVDRDAAADVVKSYRDQKDGNWQARIRRGECDDGEMVQALATHRQSGIDAGLAMGAEIDVRSIAFAAINDARQAGESREMLARWISERVKAAILAARTERGEDNPPAHSSRPAGSKT